MKENETKIFCLSSLCKLSISLSWVEYCQIFLFLTYTHSITSPMYMSLFCTYLYVSTTKWKWIAFYVIILSVYERVYIRVSMSITTFIIMPVHYTSNFPLTWKMNHVLYTRQQNNEVIKEHKHILSETIFSCKLKEGG